LGRIKQRSNRLLSFIEQYSKLSQLPVPRSSWFDFNDLLSEAKAMITEPCFINYQGTNQCYADVQQMAQILINIFKNAQEACLEEQCHIEVSLYYRQENSQGYQQTKQVIEITDNGPGFANLDNALTPFYTTKSHGSGIGLSLCAEITRNHGGEFSLENTDNGAKITMVWPVDNKISQTSSSLNPINSRVT
jgi:nitrogen fixation/metabolism regulation signal transduction histidine kinase